MIVYVMSVTGIKIPSILNVHSAVGEIMVKIVQDHLNTFLMSQKTTIFDWSDPILSKKYLKAFILAFEANSSASS